MTGCAKTQYVTQVEYLYPPEHLIVVEERATLSGNTNAHLLDWTIDLKGQVEQCNIRMESIQYWMEQHKRNR